MSNKVTKELLEKFQNLVTFGSNGDEWRRREIIDNPRLKFVKAQYKTDLISTFHSIDDMQMCFLKDTKV